MVHLHSGLEGWTLHEGTQSAVHGLHGAECGNGASTSATLAHALLEVAHVALSLLQ